MLFPNARDYKGGEYGNSDLTLNAGDSMDEYAHNLFTMLRMFDKKGIKRIYAEFAVENGIGIAVRNRLYKSAGHKIIEVLIYEYYVCMHRKYMSKPNGRGFYEAYMQKK